MRAGDCAGHSSPRSMHLRASCSRGLADSRAAPRAGPAVAGEAARDRRSAAGSRRVRSSWSRAAGEAARFRPDRRGCERLLWRHSRELDAFARGRGSEARGLAPPVTRLRAFSRRRTGSQTPARAGPRALQRIRDQNRPLIAARDERDRHGLVGQPRQGRTTAPPSRRPPTPRPRGAWSAKIRGTEGSPKLRRGWRTWNQSSRSRIGLPTPKTPLDQNVRGRSVPCGRH